MYFDPQQQAWIDSDTRAIVYREDGNDLLSNKRDNKDTFPSAPIFSSTSNDGKEKENTLIGKSSRSSVYHAVELGTSEDNISPSGKLSRVAPDTSLPVIFSRGTYARPTESEAGATSPRPSNVPSGDGVSNLERELIAMHSARLDYDQVESGNNETVEINEVDPHKRQSIWEDWSFAKTLQALEFEISEEQLRQEQRDEDFDKKELRSGSCKRQLFTISFLICLAQIAIMIAVIQEYGYAPARENPVVGPPAVGLVDYGAKVAYLIIKKNEWWRLLATIMLHGGIWHIIPNVLIQLRIGGYLNLVFGTIRWLFIYLMSGIFGAMMSCIFLPDAVGVGSSGALLGILTAWLVWIIFRWKKIPKECRGQRNCQLGIVLAAVVITLATSFSPNVDWAAHFGGALQGFLWGIVLLSNELDNKYTEWSLRIGSGVVAVGLIGYSLYYMLAVLDPKDPFENTVVD